MKRVALITSTQDAASMTIRSALLATGLFAETDDMFRDEPVFSFKEKPHVRLYLMHDHLIHAESLDKDINADLFIFLSKHSAKAGLPNVTVHMPGNFGTAEFGGQSRMLCVAPACWMHAALHALANVAQGSGYEAIMEVTHHGPYLEKPCMFMELGSTEAQWHDQRAGGIVAGAVLEVIAKAGEIGKTKSIPVAVGIGGLHNVPVLSKYVLRDQIAFGHVAAKYALADCDAGMLRQAMEQTEPKASLIVLDWKGLGSEKARIRDMVEQSGFAWKRSDRMSS